MKKNELIAVGKAIAGGKSKGTTKPAQKPVERT